MGPLLANARKLELRLAPFGPLGEAVLPMLVPFWSLCQWPVKLAKLTFFDHVRPMRDPMLDSRSVSDPKLPKTSPHRDIGDPTKPPSLLQLLPLLHALDHRDVVQPPAMFVHVC